MSFAQIIARLESMNAEISLFRLNYSFAKDDRWTASLEIKHDGKGIQLKACGTGGNVEDALQSAWGKVEAIVNTLTFSKGFEIPLLTIDTTPEREINF